MSLLAVSDQDLGAACGEITWWRLQDGAPYGALQDAWREQFGDVTGLLPATSPACALSRTLRDQTGRRVLSRPLADAGRALVVERLTQAGELEYQTDLRVSLDEIGRLVVSPPDHARADELRARFARAADELSAHELGGWMVRLVRDLEGVALRETGGVYFVPASAVPRWHDVSRVVQTANVQVHHVPVVRSQDAVQAILDAAEQEAQRAAAELRGLLDEGLTARRARTQVQACERAQAKLTRYEALLGTRVGAVRTALDGLAAELAVVALGDA